MPRFVLSHNCMPARLPVVSTIVFWLLLDHLHASQVWYGVYYVFTAFFWILSLIAFFMQKQHTPKWEE
jgi:hypothetical protein